MGKYGTTSTRDAGGQKPANHEQRGKGQGQGDKQRGAGQTDETKNQAQGDSEDDGHGGDS